MMKPNILPKKFNQNIKYCHCDYEFGLATLENCVLILQKSYSISIIISECLEKKWEEWIVAVWT